MEDILASIKRIIADDSQAATAAVSNIGRVTDDSDYGDFRIPSGLRLVGDDEDGDEPEEVLELTQPIESAANTPAAPSATQPDFKLGVQPREAVRTPEPAAQRPAAAAPPPPLQTIVSDDTAQASRQSLAALSAMIVKPEEGADNTLDGLVREMLRPMLKDWLDQRLPQLVEKLVEKEISRITGRAL